MNIKVGVKKVSQFWSVKHENVICHNQLTQICVDKTLLGKMYKIFIKNVLMKISHLNNKERKKCYSYFTPY